MRSGSCSTVRPIGSRGSNVTSISDVGSRIGSTSAGRPARSRKRLRRRAARRPAVIGDRVPRHPRLGGSVPAIPVPVAAREAAALGRGGQGPGAAGPDDDRVDRLDAARARSIGTSGSRRRGAVRARSPAGRRSPCPAGPAAAIARPCGGSSQRKTSSRQGVGWARSSVPRGRAGAQGSDRRGPIIWPMADTTPSLETAVRTLLAEIGEDPTREGLVAHAGTGTPDV